MPEIIPAIIAKDLSDLRGKINLVKDCVKTVQLDVMDGVFVPNATWNNPGDLTGLETDLFLEAHLMAENPHRILNEWLNTKVGRIILHWEAMEKIHNHELLPYETQVDAKFPVSNLSREIHRCGKQFGVALNPPTPIGVLDNFINEIDLVLLMSVNPGFAGQEFIREVIPKIVALRQRYPDVKIEVDGGINPQNIFEVAQAGADFLVMGSAIFDNQNPGLAIAKANDAMAEKK